MNRVLRTALFAGTAFAALATGMPQQASAQSITPGFFGSLSGWYYFSAGKNDGTSFEQTYNHPDGGPGGKAYLGYRFNGPFDIALGGQGGWLGTNTTHDGSDVLKSKGNYWAVDGELGYNTIVNGLGLRLFAGVRYAQFNHRNQLGDTLGMTTTFFKDNHDDYRGIGPRIGTDFSARIGSSNFSIFGDVAGSVLFGKLKQTVTETGGCTIDCTARDSHSQTVWNVEGQLGLAYEVAPGINIGAGYRAEYWHHVADADWDFIMSVDHIKSVGHQDRFMHGPFARVSYNFGAPPLMPMMAVVPPPPAPPPAPGKNYIVFFDFDRSTITSAAQATINDAVAAAKAGGSARVTLTGHTDRSGSEQYNLALSLRRAEAVKANMIKQGIPASAIVVIGKGESAPLVPTADGVREPQNRRVEIVI